jgi:CP family cyanate transporter-like MFS transporter
MLSPTTASWLPALLIGLGGGSFPMALTLMALRSRTHSGTMALSAFGQSVGYLMASIGPVGFGFLHDVSGGWTVPLIALMAVLAVLLFCGMVVVRGWAIEDDLAR